jgi:4-hydroxythreonine-4-phosphate dehydrogenase
MPARAYNRPMSDPLQDPASAARPRREGPPADPPLADRPLALTMGDACGIGPEIVIKACAERARTSDRAALVVYGDAGILEREARRLGLPQPPHIVACSALPDDLPLGCIDARAGQAAHDAVLRASQDALAGRVRAVVTAPLHKEALHAAGIRHPGHTEILADVAGVTDVRMMLVNDELRTLLVTIHVPLREAIERITFAAVLDTLRIGHAGLQRMGIARPRIAVAGLNPHAGEGGLMGREDLDIIAPAIAQARAEGIDASGPWPGDTVFMRARGHREFDLVVAMYHDQGLIPIKYLGIDTGVNVTVGLPFVRTSVDHGTAFDIAGRGIADHRSLLAAIHLAEQLTPSNP